MIAHFILEADVLASAFFYYIVTHYTGIFFDYNRFYVRSKVSTKKHWKLLLQCQQIIFVSSYINIT